MPVSQWNTAAAMIFGLFILYVLSRVLCRPIKAGFRLIIHLILGGGIIALYNYFGASLNLTVGLNMISSLLVGIMGIPGLLMLIGIRFVLA